MGMTELAFNSLNYNEQLEDKYSEPGEVIKYLRNPGNFRTLNSLIKDTMVEAQKCTESDDITIVKKNLSELLTNVNPKYKDNDSLRKRLDRWMDNSTESIKSFDNAIEVCYALGLDLKQTNTFLNKSGFCSLGVRNAKHAIHYYCFLKNKPMSDFQIIYDKYIAAEIPEPKENNLPKSIEDGSSTTIILFKDIKADWESDEKFLSSFLIPNKSKFIGYSKSALFDYYRIKCICSATILVELAEEESAADFSSEDNPLAYLLRSKLRKYNFDQAPTEVSELLRKISDNISYPTIPQDAGDDAHSVIVQDTRKAFCDIKNAIFDLSDIASLKDLSAFLHEIISIEGFYNRFLDSLVGKDKKVRALQKGINEYFKPIMKCFPVPKTIKAYEDNPVLEDNILSARKLLIFLYFNIFCIEWTIRYNSKQRDYVANAKEVFDTFTLDEFMEVVNKSLDLCCLPPLYPPNQFDYLFLLNARKIETIEIYDEYEPLVFINETLRLMYDNTEE